MDARQAFKFGFMSRCIELGVTDPDRMQVMAKQASEKMAAPGLKDVLGTGWGATKWLLDKAWPLWLFGPPAVGGVAGHALAKLTDVEETDVDEIRRQELIEEMDRQSDILRHRAGKFAR